MSNVPERITINERLMLKCAPPDGKAQRAAAIVVCGRAIDHDDASTLLQMLGIIDSLEPIVENRGSVGKRAVKPCGTYAAAQRHKANGQPLCPKCKRAYQEYCRKKNAERRRPLQLQPCGTSAAYRRHRKRGEVPCRACTEAMTIEKRRQKKRWRERKRQQRQEKSAS